MKRGLLFILFTLLLIPAVSAAITVTGPAQAQYNIGDDIDLSGYIQESEDLSADLKISLVCGTKTYNLPTANIDVTAGEKVFFSQLSLPTLTASSSMVGICKIKANVLVNNIVTETASSSSFEITNDVDGSFSTDKSQVQLGDTITLSGTVNKVDGEPFDGTAEVYFEYLSEEYLMGFIDVESGLLTYTHSFESGSAGTYDVNLIVRDSYGNEQSFNSVETFTVLDELQVFVNTNEQSLSPGDIVNVFGDVTTVLQEYVSTATVQISFDGTAQSTSLADSKYTQDILIPATITSGQHAITVEVEDSYGNHGSSSITIEIEPKATSIEASISNRTLNPEDQISIGVTLYDQAGDVMEDTVALDVYDSRNRVVSETDILSEESITYQIPKFATPGEWTIKSYYADVAEGELPVEVQEVITINEVQKLDYHFEGDLLYITNVGNVKFSEDLDIEVEGVDQSYLIKKTKNLGVNETIVIDLAEELPTGSYTVSIPTGYNTAEQSEVSIENGKSRTTLTWPYTVVAILFILALGYLIYARFRPKKKVQEQAKPAIQKDKVRKIRLYDPKREAEKGKKVNLTFEDKEQGLADFKARTLEEIKKTEDKIQKESRGSMLSEGKLGYVTGRNDPAVKPKATQEKPSVFNLFDDD